MPSGNAVRPSGEGVSCPGMWLSSPHVSSGPTEQQRVTLLSRSPSGPKKYFPIPVAQLEEEVRVRSADDCKRFREEFSVSVEAPLSSCPGSGTGKRGAVVEGRSSRRRGMCARVTMLPQRGFWTPGFSCEVPAPPSSLFRKMRRLSEMFLKVPSSANPLTAVS